jgi:hypothetical protein
MRELIQAWFSLNLTAVVLAAAGVELRTQRRELWGGVGR